MIKNLEINGKDNSLFSNYEKNIASGYLIQSFSRFFTLENCVNNINIKGLGNGGLCGVGAGNSGGNVYFTNCYNNGTIYHPCPSDNRLRLSGLLQTKSMLLMILSCYLLNTFHMHCDLFQ